MASVEIGDIQKSYDTFQVIHDVSLKIEDGEFVTLVGPSGCGKSTLLRMIAGLEEISGGTIRIGTTVVNDMPPRDRDIAMVFQNYALYPHMSVAQNMAFSLKLKGLGKGAIAAKVRSVAEILNLQDLLDRQPAQLSGGQRQRVAMGRAIVRDPKVFLFDEPLSNLDAKLRVSMRGEIKSLQQRLGTTMVYVTHDQVEAMTMADKIVVMRSGRIEQTGTPLELYDQPVNVFVAGFIGSPAMNFLDGVMVEGGVRVGERVLPAAGGHNGKNGMPVWYGVRPEHLALSDGGIPAKVVVTEPTGSETQIVAEFESQQITCLFRERLSVKPGETISLLADRSRVHLFDKASERRL